MRGTWEGLQQAGAGETGGVGQTHGGVLGRAMRRALRPSEFEVKSKRGRDYGSAITVVAWVIDVLKSERGIEAAPNVHGVKRFDDVFAAVVQAAVAE